MAGMSRGLCFGLTGAVLLSACASPIEKMSAVDAIKFANQQFFEMPNYRVDMSQQLVDWRLIQSEANEPDMSRFGDAFNKYANFFGKKFVFESTAIVDTPNQQFQVIPRYAYKSKNMNADIQLPLVYNHKNKQLFADLSAMSGLLGDIQNDGKYSRFDVSSLPIPPDADTKLLKVMRKYTDLITAGAKTDSFKELPLTDADKQRHAVRKIQYELAPKDVLTHIPMMFQDTMTIFAPDSDLAKLPFPQKDMLEFQEEMSKFLGKDSKETYAVSFNKAGQVVAIDNDSYYVMHMNEMEGKVPTMGASNSMNLRMKTRINVSDIGRATLIDVPTDANSVDGKENMKNSVLGAMLWKEADKELEESSDVADAAVGAAIAVDATKPARKHRTKPKNKVGTSKPKPRR